MPNSGSNSPEKCHPASDPPSRAAFYGGPFAFLNAQVSGGHSTTRRHGIIGLGTRYLTREIGPVDSHGDRFEISLVERSGERPETAHFSQTEDRPL